MASFAALNTHFLALFLYISAALSTFFYASLRLLLTRLSTMARLLETFSILPTCMDLFLYAFWRRFILLAYCIRPKLRLIYTNSITAISLPFTKFNTIFLNNGDKF